MIMPSARLKKPPNWRLPGSILLKWHIAEELVFPIYDDNPTEIFPIFTLGLIAATVFVWVYVQGAGLSLESLDTSICALGMIPVEITGQAAPGAGVRLGLDVVCRLGGLTWHALLTSVFLHGGWMHILGNMWFLWIFGNNVEDSMGHLRFLIFYLLIGVVAGLGHVASDPSSPIPTVGASGAVSGIMGAYMVLYPRAQVATAFWFIIFVRVIELPAFIMLGLWFGFQILSTVLQPPGVSGGVAFWAHIAGFVAGVVLIPLFRSRRLMEAKRKRVKLDVHEIPYRGWF
jgi:membrane associated rhomboid family serine protease